LSERPKTAISPYSDADEASAKRRTHSTCHWQELPPKNRATTTTSFNRVGRWVVAK
jgi:hypothetical protein